MRPIALTRAEEFLSWRDELEGWPVRFTCYRVGARYHCQVDNANPGAVIARGQGEALEEAKEQAVSRARKRLTGTRRRDI